MEFASPEADDADNHNVQVHSKQTTKAADVKFEQRDKMAPDMEATSTESPCDPNHVLNPPTRLGVNRISRSPRDNDPRASEAMNGKMLQKGMERCGLKYKFYNNSTVGKRLIA